MVRAALVLLCASVGGCRCGGEGRVLAELLETSGQVDEWLAGDPQAWSPAAAGRRFHEGDAVRTQAGASARLRLEDRTAVRMAEKTVIRFGRGVMAPRLDVGEGAAELEAPATTEVELGFGVARLSGGARVRVDHDGQGQRIEVLVGNATLLGGDGGPLAMEPGRRYVVGVGTAQIRESAPPDALPAAPDAAVAPPPLLARVEGRGVRVLDPATERWQRLPQGEHRLPPGAAIESDKRSGVTLEREGERAVVRGPARLVAGAPGGALLELRRGRAEISATTHDVRVRVPGGAARALQAAGDGSRALVEVDPKRTQVRVTRGTLELAAEGGAGERLEIGTRAVLYPAGRIEVQGKPPERADVAVPADGSLVLHDASPPLAVRIRFPEACRGEGIVEVARRAGDLARAPEVTRGVGSAIVALPAGRRAYRVRCIVGGVLADGAVARGTLTVTRDAGKRRLPRRVPDNTVEADGRAYRVVYQNLLPHVTFLWRTDLLTGPFRLFVEGEKGGRNSIGGDNPVLTMASGELAEGRYRFWFEHADARSEVSTLSIEFDNASPRAYVEDLEPAGEGLRVSGAALEGWRVYVGDAPAPLDRENRFSLEVPRPADAAGVAVRLVSPNGEVHTYVRRAP